MPGGPGVCVILGRGPHSLFGRDVPGSPEPRAEGGISGAGGRPEALGTSRVMGLVLTARARLL